MQGLESVGFPVVAWVAGSGFLRPRHLERRHGFRPEALDVRVSCSGNCFSSFESSNEFGFFGARLKVRFGAKQCLTLFRVWKFGSRLVYSYWLDGKLEQLQVNPIKPHAVAERAFEILNLEARQNC